MNTQFVLFLVDYQNLVIYVKSAFMLWLVLYIPAYDPRELG